MLGRCNCGGEFEKIFDCTCAGFCMHIICKKCDMIILSTFTNTLNREYGATVASKLKDKLKKINQGNYG